MRGVPKLNLRQRQRFKANPRSAPLSARENVSRSHNKMRAKSVTVRQAAPLSARTDAHSSRFNSGSALDRVQHLRYEKGPQTDSRREKPHTPNGRPAPHRMQSGRVREDMRNIHANSTDVPETDTKPETSSTQHKDNVGRNTVNDPFTRRNVPRSSGFQAPPSRKPSATLSDEVRRGNNELNVLRNKVNELRGEINEKDRMLALAKKQARMMNPAALNSQKSSNLTQAQSAAASSSASIASKLNMGPHVRVVRDKEALLAAQRERDQSQAELKVLEARFRSVKQRGDEAHAMLSERIKRIASLEKAISDSDAKYKLSIKGKDECIAQLRAKLEDKDEKVKKTEEPQARASEHAKEANALRVQVAKLAKDLHEEKEKNAAVNDKMAKLALDIKCKSSEEKIKKVTEMRNQMATMQNTLGAQKRRISELEAKMRLQVSGHADKSSVQAKRFEEALSTMKKDLEKTKAKLLKAEKDTSANTAIKESLTKITTELNAKVAELSRATATISKLKQDLSTARAETQIRKNAIAKEESARKAAELAETSLGKCKKQRDEAMGKCKIIESSLEKANITLAAEQKVIETLRKRVGTLEQELKSSESQRSRISGLQKAAEDSERRLREAQAQNSVMTRRSSTLASEKEGLAKHIRDLQQQLKDQSRSSKEAVEKAEQVAKSCIQDLEKSHSEAVALLNEAKCQAIAFASKKSRQEESLKWKSKVQALEEEIKSLKCALKEAKEELAKTKAHAEEVKALAQAANERAASAMDHSKNMASLWQAERLRIEEKASKDLSEAVKASKARALQELEKAEKVLKKQIHEAKARENAIRKDFDHETATSSLLREKLAETSNKLESMKLQEKKGNANANKKLEAMSRELKATRQLLHDVKQAAKREEKDLKAVITKLEAQVNSYAELERQLNATLKQVDLNNKRCSRLQDERDAAIAALKGAEASNISRSEDKSNEIKSLQSKIKVLHKKLEKSEFIRQREAKEAEKAYQEETENIVSKHKSEVANLKTALAVVRSDLKRNQDEFKAAKEMHERELSDALSVFQADHDRKTSENIAKLKKNEAHHKRTIATQVERLKKLRLQLEEQKKAAASSRDAFKKKECALETSVKKLKSLCAKLKSTKNNSGVSDGNLEDRIMKAQGRVEELSEICGSLSAAIAAEAKGSSYLSNLSVLIKTGEAAQCQKKATQLKKELHNAKKVHSVLMYNVKYGEKALSKYDKKAAAKQVQARTDSLLQLEKDIEESRRKEKRFQETSDANVDELEALKKGAKQKLINARQERKDLCEKMERHCKLLSENLHT